MSFRIPSGNYADFPHGMCMGTCHGVHRMVWDIRAVQRWACICLVTGRKCSGGIPDTLAGHRQNGNSICRYTFVTSYAPGPGVMLLTWRPLRVLLLPNATALGGDSELALTRSYEPGPTVSL